MVKFLIPAILFFSFIIHAEGTVFYQINLTDWPLQMLETLQKEVPEISDNQLTEEKLNQILKQLDIKFHFNNLKLVQSPHSNELRLVGEISPQIESIEFQGLREISEGEALLVMNLSTKTANDEDNVKTSIEKLIQYYQEQGFRFTTADYQYSNLSTFKRKLVIRINTKEQTKISEIDVRNVDQETQERIHLRLNAAFKNDVLNQNTLAKLSTKLRQLLSENGYYLTAVPPVQLIFSADELKARALFKLDLKQRYSIEIINANEFSNSYLENDILKLETYFSSESNFGADLTEKLKLFYQTEGYPHISVSYYERKEKNKIFITLNLDEGPFVRIKQIQFTGQLSRPLVYYEKKLAELSAIKANQKYVKEDIEAGIKNLLIYLQNEGFVSARLGLVQVLTDRENPKSGLVNIQIYEGDQVDIDRIDFVGNTFHSTQILTKELGLQPGQKLNLKTLEEATNKLKVFYASSGFIEFKLVNESTNLIQYSNKNSSAQLKFIIDEGPRVEVQSILIEGNETTHEKVILTEIDFKPGDILTPAKLEESISRLQRTGHFRSIDITTLESGTQIATRTVLIKVTERDPGVFTIGTGLTNENNGTLHGYTGIAYRNIGGWGRGISARIEGNYNFAGVKFLESRLTVGFVEPYLLETRTRFRINLTRSSTISNYQLRKVTELNSATYSLEQDFTSHITGIYDLLNVATYVDRGATAEDEVVGGYTREDLVIVSTGPTLDLDYRNNLFNPTDGSFSRFTFEYSFEGGSIKIDQFIRFTGQTTFYIPVYTTDLVFAQSFRGGYVQDIKQMGFGIPFDKKGFTLGGRTTIRGFDSGELFPSEKLIGPSFKLKSFASYQLIKSELRFPLVRKWDLFGAVFYDGGQVSVDGFNFEDKWRDAVGVGIRYNTPVGPLNLEYAKKLDKKPYENAEAFHLSIGVF